MATEISLHSIGSDLFGGIASEIATALELHLHHSRSGEFFVSGYQPTSAECILFDFEHLGTRGLQIVVEARRWSWQTPILVIDSAPSISHAVSAFQIGASDYAEASLDRPELCNRANHLVEQCLAIDETVFDRAKRLSTLTPGEVEVMHLFLNAETTKAIARHLSICQKTVENRRARIYEKMNVDSIPELLKLWLNCRGSQFLTDPRDHTKCVSSPW